MVYLIMYKRLQNMLGSEGETCFLWGARQTGKSSLLKNLFPKSQYYDFLLSDEFERFNKRPSLLREEMNAVSISQYPIIIDEVQRVPEILNEIQWLIVNKHIPFILCGSNSRKLKHGGGNLLGGRALRYELHPLVWKEIPDFDLIRALNHGLLPRHYLASTPLPKIQAYVGDYLKEEIAGEAMTRNIPAFGRFLEVASFSNGQIVNYQNIASECGVSAPTVKEYFQILEDTLIAKSIPSYRKKAKRETILTSKFYFFDVGIANFLIKRGKVQPKGESFGYAFEHFIFQELIAHTHYSRLFYPISYWRTRSQMEVDFILGEAEVAIEIKGKEGIESRHIAHLKAFQEEFKPKKSIVVCLEKRPRIQDGVEILPWEIFLERLWNGEIIT